MRRVPPLFVACALAVLCAIPAIAQIPTPETEVARGIQQVRDGDFEGAIVTLDAAVAALKSEPGRSRPLLVQAYINLGVAHVALDHEEPAQRAFREALALEPNLRVGTDRFSPKVVRTFDAAREAATRERAAARPKKGNRTALIVGGVAAAAAGGVVLATRGGDGNGVVTFGDARFGTPVLVCLDGSVGVPLPFHILVEARNPSGEPVRITDVTSTIIIRASPGFPAEIGLANSAPTEPTPATVPAGSNVTVRLDTLIVCGNGPGDAIRFNEWSGTVTLGTSAGVFTLETQNLMRINLP